MGNLTLSSPWIQHYRKIQALFKHDRNINIVLDQSNEERPVVTLYVTDPDKAVALDELVRKNVEFGAVSMQVVVKPANPELQLVKVHNTNPYTSYRFDRSLPEAPDIQKKLDAAFVYNNAYCYTASVTGIGGVVWTYAIFSKKVVQYPSDDISDYYGVTSTLYENIARDGLIDIPGVFYCTNKPKKYKRREDDE